MDRHRGAGGLVERLGIVAAGALPLVERPAERQIAVERIVRGGLVGHSVGADAAADHLGKDLRGVAEQSDRDCVAGFVRFRDDRERLVDAVRLRVEIAGLQPHLDPRRLAFDREARGAGHRRGKRLRAAHAAEARGQDPAARQAAAVMLAAHLDEGFVGALNDPLAADIDPAAGGHLAVHHQALAIELVEMRPRSPSAARGWNWRAARAAHRHGCGRCRRACPTG